MAGERPYLSVVVTARNDDHGGNLLGRMQAFVNGWVGQSRRHGLTSELIFVEWNPPEDRPRLVDALRWPKELGPCQVRILQVPPELHRRYAHAEALPLYQMMAKNAGIRRARGRFVLATNVDIIFSDELVGFLAQRKLEPRRMYRIDRHDVMPEVPIDGIEEQLAYCRTHLIRINAREGTFNLTPEGRRAPHPSDIAAIDSGITFGPGWFPVERVSATEKFRWATTYAELELAPPYPGARHLRLDVEPGPGAGSNPLEVLLTSAKGEQFARATLNSRGILRVPVEGIAGEVPFVIRFRVLNGGRSIPSDTRILEFRVFRCDWDPEIPEEPIMPALPEIQAPECDCDAEIPEEPRALSPAPEPPEIQTPKPDCDAGIPEPLIVHPIAVGRPPRPPSLWERFQRFLAMVAHGGDVILVPVAVWPWVKRAVRLYVDSGGFTGLLRRGFRREKIVVASATIGATPPSTISTYPLQVQLQIIAATPPSEIPAEPPQAPIDATAATPPSEIPAEPPQAPIDMIAAAPPSEIPANVQQAPIDTIAASPPDEISADPPLAPIDATASTPPSEISADPPQAPINTLAATPPVEISANAQQAPINTLAATPPVEISANAQQAQLHTNGCGDFTLMALENWLDFRGYPEFDTFSMHLDSIFCFSAHHGGVVEEVLGEPMRIYHIEHGTGSGWTPEGQAKLFARIAERGLSMIENPEVIAWAKQMQKLRCPMIFNLENWGLADFDLPETTVASSIVKSA
jgi:hypothetical protein